MESKVVRASCGGQGPRAAVYLRVGRPGFWGVVDEFEQRCSFTGFGVSDGYGIVRWYIEGVGSATGGYALSRLMEDVVAPGRDFDAVLVWKCPHLGHGEMSLADVRRTLDQHGVGLVSVGASPWGKSDEANPKCFR